MNDFNFTFKLKDYINTNPITITDKSLNKTWTIKFTNNIVDTKTQSEDIFNLTTDFQPKITRNGTEITVDMCLYQNSYLNLLFQFLFSLIQLQPHQIVSINNIPLTVPTNLIIDCTSIGVNPLNVVVDSSIIDYNDYTKDYIIWYVKNNHYVYTVINQSHKPLKVYSSISNYEVIYYNQKQGCYCDLIQLFNIHSTNSEFQRFFLHDIRLDDYYNANPKIYIKANVSDKTNLKHVQNQYSTLTLAYLAKVNDNIMLNDIDIYNDGSFKFYFIINGTISLSNIEQAVNKYLDEHLEELFDKTLIKHTSYFKSIDDLMSFGVKDYRCEMFKMKSVYKFNDINLKTLSAIRNQFFMLGHTSRFSSNTSIALSLPSFFNRNILHNIGLYYNVNNTANENIMTIFIIPEIHFTFADTDLSIFCNKFYSPNEVKFILPYILPLIEYTETYTATSSQSLNTVRARVLAIPVKQNLKELYGIDPILFGTRQLDSAQRAYSALCQDKEQRPSIITKNEYDLIKDIVPDSVCRVDNQTYKNQSIHLYCPYEINPTINFKHYKQQKCIVKCTAKQTSSGQFNYCAEQLHADVSINPATTKISKLKIKFTDSLSYGRYCQLPKELLNVFPNCKFVNSISVVPENTTLASYLYTKHGCYPFIMQRNDITKEYIILSDFNDKKAYCLVVIPSLQSNYYYIMLGEKQHIVPNISENPNFVKLITTISNDSFVRVLNKILNLTIISTSIYNYIQQLIQLEYMPVVKNRQIVAVVSKDKTLYYIPSFPFDEGNLDNNAKGVLDELLNGKLKYPNIKDYVLEENDRYCLNIDNQIVGIFWFLNNRYTLMLTKPIKYSNELNVVRYGTTKYHNLILNTSNIQVIKQLTRLNSVNSITVIVHMLLRYYTYITNEYDKTKFIDFCYDFGILTPDNSIYEKKNLALFDILKTKINVKEFTKVVDGIIFSQENISDILYNDLRTSLILPHESSEKIVTKLMVS